MKSKCILCNKDSYHFKTINDYNIYKCISCGLDFVHPMPTDSTLQKFYDGYIDYRQSKLIARQNAIKNIEKLKDYDILNQNKFLLDYACGDNIFVRFGSHKWYGYDKFVKKDTDIENYSKYKWDFITIWGSLEHFTKPLETFKELSSIMNDEGKIIMRQVVTDVEIPFRYKPPEHLTYWNREALELLFKKSGFKIIKYEPYTMIQNSKVYLDCILRTVPEEYKMKIFNSLPSIIEVPTNEIFIVGEKI